MPPTLEQVRAARPRVARVARHTPLERSGWLSDLAGVPVHLKLECWQPTRSFKVRGAANAVLDEEGEVVTASAGNHGLGVALATRMAERPATVFVPAGAPETKRRRIEHLGARLVTVDGSYDDAETAARTHADRSGGRFVHPSEDPEVVAGQGTVALEALEDLPETATFLVPVGGGGLVAGIGAVARERGGGVVGVQSERTRTLYESVRAGRPVETRVVPTLADGLAGGRVGEEALGWVAAAVDEWVLVSEEGIARAIGDLYREEGVVAEGAAAVGVAALLEGYRPEGATVVVISGGNIDAGRLADLLAG